MSFRISSGALNSLLQGRGFGSFRVKKYKGYKGRNPKQANLSRSSPRNCPFSNAAKS